MLKKEFFKYLIIVTFLGLAGTALGYGVKKLQTSPVTADEESKTEAEDKNTAEEVAQETESSVKTALAVEEKNGIQEEKSESKKGLEGAEDQDISEKIATQPAVSQYFIHRNITTTYFWAGEEAGKDNKNISNLPSAWDEQWVKHFGGVDDPKKRSGFFPTKFSPKENPFYFALPYNDFDSKGKRKQEVYSLIPWAKGKTFGKLESACKNRWIKIMKGGKVAYAQWQDVGPFKEDDKNYVFGAAAPKSKTNNNAGLDVSPAVKDYLGLADIDKTDWQFVDSNAVPGGPWKKVVTTSQCYWK